MDEEERSVRRATQVLYIVLDGNLVASENDP